MKRFIKHTIAFLVVSILVLFLFNYSVFKIVSINTDYRLNKNIKGIILGNSYPECALNDSLIPNIKNVAKSGEPYLYTYQKLKKLLSQNKQIERVYLEYTNLYLHLDKDQKMWSYRETNMFFFYYSPFMKYHDFKNLYANNKDDFFKFFSHSLRRNLVKIARFDYKLTDKQGGYDWLVRFKTDSLVKVNSHKEINNKKSKKLSKYNVAYLKKIRALCKEKQVKLILIRSPLHSLYPIDNEQVFQELLNTHFKEVEFLDFKNFPLKDGEFGDFDHLNYLGAKKFSKYFNSVINDLSM